MSSSYSEPAGIDAVLVRTSAFLGIAILAITTAVSPNGAAIAIAFLGPVFVPALVGVVIAIAPRARRVRRVVAAALMTPGFALASFLAANYSPEHSDTPARFGTAAASVIEVIGPVGGVLALVSLAIAVVRARDVSRARWAAALIGVGDLLVLAVGLSVSAPG